MRDRLILASLVLAAFVFQGCQHMGGDEGDVEVVEMQSGNVFVPDNLTITAGTTVLWRNVDSIVHTTTANDQTWNSGTMQGGDTYERTFDEAGVYEYHCIPHASVDDETGECTGMCATIVVEEADQEQGST